MKRKNLNVVKLENVIQDKKFFTIYSKLKSVLSKNKSNGSLAVAISGGPDSMALAFLSSKLMDEKKLKVHFLLVDHGIRKNSGNEAQKVKSLLKKKGIDLKILKKI